MDGEEAVHKVDMVNHPSHYTQGGIEVIEMIKIATGEGYADYLLGNVLKYLFRYKYKNGVEDLLKAVTYLNWLTEEVENK